VWEEGIVWEMNGLTYNTISWIIINIGRKLNSNESDSESGLEAPSPA
jgi:hypothetical protein